ncbi:MAG: pectinesterase family protein [Terracidiphilus sp.]|nr:pectinesterase family protein [Terracidiphilus sp.]
MHRNTLRAFAAALPLLLALAGRAQDTRTVTEPKIPAACVTLDAAIAAPNGVVAEADEKRLDTVRIQTAMDGCTKGKAVILRAKGNKYVFIAGPLTMRPGVTLVVAAHTVLAAARDPRLFDVEPGRCGIVAERGRGCKPFLSGDHVEGAGLMGEGSIDGRGGANLLGKNVTWWDLAHEAKVKDLEQSVPKLIVLSHADGFTMYKITLRNSPNFHVSINQTDGLTVWGVNVRTPKAARNTDAIDPGSSRNITIAYVSINTGDDDVCLKPAPGRGVQDMSVLHSHFYAGHGMSIGSGTDGGADHLLVDDLTIDGADNGLRIKSDPSRGGYVHDITYRNVCIRNVMNPLVFTPHYTTFKGTKLPIYRDITLENVRVTTPGAFTFLGLDAEHKLGIKLDNVWADNQKESLFYVKDAEIALGPRKGNLTPAGDNATPADAAGATAGEPLNCDARFVPMAEIPTAPELKGKVPEEDPTLYVAADGTGDFYSIQRALDVAKPGSIISVAPGEYREVLTVSKPHITIRSHKTDAGRTVVVNDRNAGENGGTFRSATVNVTADDFFAENVTFENDFNKTHAQKTQGSQALALLVTGDRARFHNVRLLGNQDTVYTATKNCGPDGKSCTPTRQYFSDCYIAGNVDFIFGDSKAVFENCEIHSTPHGGGYITAQSKHYPEQDSGFVLDRCKLTQDEGVTGDVFLGRPWRAYATVVYLNTEMGGKIAAAGFREWHPGETHALETVYYAEFNSTGPGAHKGERDTHVHQLTTAEAKQWEPKTFLKGSDNWDPTALPKQ